MFSRSLLALARLIHSRACRFLNRRRKQRLCTKIAYLQTSYFFAQQRANVCFADRNLSLFCFRCRGRLHGGGGPKVGEVTLLCGVTRLSV